MASQAFIDKLNDTRVAIQTLVNAILSAYYNKSETESIAEDTHRFINPTTGTVLVAPVRLVPDNAAGVCTYTLPAAPANGDVIEWRASSTAFSVNSLVFQRNGNTILGEANDLTVDTDGVCGRLVWDATGSTWMVDNLGVSLEVLV